MSTIPVTAARPRISDRTLARVQAGSGLLFATFLVLHLATAASAIAGQSAYDTTLGAMRHYYQFVIVEVLAVLGASLVHIGAGVMRMLRRRGRRALPIPLRLRLHRYAGYYLMAAYAGHVTATRIVPFVFDLQPDFTFLHWSLTTVPYFFYPYYTLLALSGAYHLAHGVLAGLKVLGAKLPGRTTSPRSKPFWACAAIWAVLGVLIVLALGGQLFAVDTTNLATWNALAEQLLGSAP